MNFIESDIVWHNAYTSETQIWTMGGGFQIKARGTVEDENGKPILVGLPWSIVAAKDFDHSGVTDIVWHNANTGETQIWLMNGFQIAGRRTVEDENSKPIFVGLPWRIVGANELATDGNTRILWHNADTGETQLWLMNGFQIASRHTVEDENRKPIFVGLPWRIVGTGHFDPNQPGEPI